MHILVSNDDGVNAEGIKALQSAMQSLAQKVTVVAPDRNRSGASNSLTLNDPLRVQRLSKDRYAVEGTPTDCVHLAVTGMLEDTPQMVVSGINHGLNMGDDILYSGTVAAAIEGRSLGLTSIAFSQAGSRPAHRVTGIEVAKLLVARTFIQTLPAQTILNVNIPDIPFDQLEGFEVTRLGTRHRAEKPIKMIDPRGNEIYWIGLPGAEQDAGPGTDFHAIAHNRVSITPIHIDLTYYKGFDLLANWVDNIDFRKKL